MFSKKQISLLTEFDCNSYFDIGWYVEYNGFIITSFVLLPNSDLQNVGSDSIIRAAANFLHTLVARTHTKRFEPSQDDHYEREGRVDEEPPPPPPQKICMDRKKVPDGGRKNHVEKGT